MSVLASTPAVGEMTCGCVRDLRGMAVLCGTAAGLKAEAKAAFRASNDRSVKGGARTELCREFDRRRTAYREHIGLGA